LNISEVRYLVVGIELEVFTPREEYFTIKQLKNLNKNLKLQTS